MSSALTQNINAKLAQLPPLAQAEVLDFIDFMLQKQKADKKAEISTQSTQETLSQNSPKKSQVEIRQLLAATRGCIPGKKTKDEIDREIRLMREEWVREWE
jgi:hypothetical protein